MTEYQLRKIKKSIEKESGVSLTLKVDQIGKGSQKYKLSEGQLNKLKKAKSLGKGCRLSFTYQNLKNGGYLPLIFAGLGALVTGVSSGVNAYSDYKNKRVAEKENERHNKEMEEILKKTSKISIGLD